MSTLREAAQKALEALEMASAFKEGGTSKARTAVATLRAALAEPAADWETRAELAEQQVVDLAEERDHYRGQCEELRQRLAGYRPASLAEPEQDPVAYLIRGSDAADKLCASVVYQELGSALDCAQAFARRYSTVRTLPLYTHPAPAKQPGQIVVTKSDDWKIVAVTRQDSDGRVLEVIAESALSAMLAVCYEALVEKRGNCGVHA